MNIFLRAAGNELSSLANETNRTCFGGTKPHDILKSRERLTDSGCHDSESRGGCQGTQREITE
jgi:hypothetical protein